MDDDYEGHLRAVDGAGVLYGEAPKMLCGSTSASWVFISLAHAQANAASGSRLTLCPQCAQKAKDKLQTKMWST